MICRGHGRLSRKYKEWHTLPPPKGLEAWLLDWHSSTDLSNGHPCDGAGAKANFKAQKYSPGDWFTKTFGVLP